MPSEVRSGLSSPFRAVFFFFFAPKHFCLAPRSPNPQLFAETRHDQPKPTIPHDY